MHRTSALLVVLLAAVGLGGIRLGTIGLAVGTVGLVRHGGARHRILGKDEVGGSNPPSSSTQTL